MGAGTARPHGLLAVKLLLELLWLALPVILAGVVHLTVLKLDLLPGLRKRPIDGGICFRGRRLFGDNKTWRGALIMIASTAIAAALLASINSSFVHWSEPAPFAQHHPFAWGTLLGVGYILGELPNSFIKRQFDIAPGAMGKGATGRVFWVVDQLDSLAGMLLMVLPVWQPDLAAVAALACLMLVGHPIGAWVMMRFGLKDRVG